MVLPFFHFNSLRISVSHWNTHLTEMNGADAQVDFVDWFGLTSNYMWGGNSPLPLPALNDYA